MIKLYQYEYCPFCVIVRNKLAELEIEYETIEVNPKHKPSPVTDTGGTVPVIDDDGMIMNESADIVDYLQNKYGK